MKRIIASLILLLLIGILYGKVQEEKLVFTYPVGTSSVVLLSERQKTDNSNILIDASEEILKKYIPDGTYSGAFNAFLIQTSEHNILVDAGLGTKLFDNLASINKSTDDIDIILLTHMHGDHIGGLLRDGIKSFPNALLYIPQKEYDYWTNREIMESQPENRRTGFINAQKVIEAYKNKLHLFTPGEIGNDRELLPGIYPVAAYGHTPGHTGYLFRSDGKSIFIWGDMVNCMPVQVPHPEIATVHDIDPVAAAATREYLLNYLAENKIPIGGMHIQYPAIGDIIKDASGTFQFILLPAEER